MDDEIRDPELAEEEAPESENDLDLGTDDGEDDPFAATVDNEENPEAHGFSIEGEGKSSEEEI